MKKYFAIVLVVIMLLTMAGCGTNISQEEVDQLQARIDELESTAAIKDVYALNATIDGKPVVQITGETTLTAQATLEDGMKVDHWELNGEAQPDTAAESFSFTAAEAGTVEAILRPVKKVTAVNCELHFLDADGAPAGDCFQEFVFEDPYTNPVTGEEVADGTISLQVSAVIPDGYIVDYWLINGVAYYADNLNSFIVKNLDEATEYEVVVKEKPITYYKVTCKNCTVDGKSELWVAAGTRVTAKCYSGYCGTFIVGGSAVTGEYATTCSTVVKGNVYIEFNATVN